MFIIILPYYLISVPYIEIKNNDHKLTMRMLYLFVFMLRDFVKQ